MLLTFSVYSAQNLDVAEEIAKKVIRDLLRNVQMVHISRRR